MGVVEDLNGDVHVEILIGAIIQRLPLLVLCVCHGHRPKASGLAQHIWSGRHPRETVTAAIPSFKVCGFARPVCTSLDALPQAHGRDGGHEEQDGSCDGQAPDGLDFVARRLAGVNPLEDIG